jgi:MFS superfamily sulfate permease-like transporter
MIQMLGQVVLSAVLIVWGYQVASRVRRRPVWLWPGVGAAVVFGFLALTAVYVAEGASASIRGVAATVASVLYGIVVALCVALFVVVSRAATRPVEAEPETAPQRSMWEPKDGDQPPVIVDDTPWHSGGVIDAGTAPRRAARAYEDAPEHKFAPPEEPLAQAHDQEVVAEHAATLPMNSTDASPADDDDDEAWEQIKPRRAMSAEPDPGGLNEW